MGLLISYNLVCKQQNKDFYKMADIIRLNSPWYTHTELEDILKIESKPKFLDINIKERTKPKIYNHRFEDLIRLAGKYQVEWVGISNVEVTSTYYDVKKLLKNDVTNVCAKVETKNGCDNIQSIIEHFDGVMVDVEDLAFSIGWNEATKEKERIYKLCDEKGVDHFKLSGVIFEHVKKDKIVYTYGAWDLLHPGHIKLLERAKSYGTYLVVGVVGDDAIKKLKGNDRPIQSLQDRCDIIASLKCVDEVMEQTDYNPVPNLEKVFPDILVKGDDWDYIPGEEWVKEHNKKLIKPSYSTGWSTSSMVKKIREGK
jgi:D-glycero-beta-D-manno-heptose 1-phosphate adenylyltransferase